MLSCSALAMPCRVLAQAVLSIILNAVAYADLGYAATRLEDELREMEGVRREVASKARPLLAAYIHVLCHTRDCPRLFGPASAVPCPVLTSATQLPGGKADG